MSVPVRQPILRAEAVHKTYARAGAPIEAVRGVSLTLAEGEFVAVMGPSGCGKSTLLHLCGAMDRPTSGRIVIGGAVVDELGDDALTDLRRTKIGFVFQFFNLLPTLTVLENISLPLLLAGRPAGDVTRHAEDLAGRVGLSHRLGQFPRQLSGGEAQRVAIARAVIHEPMLVMADEPTGNLDSVSGAHVLRLLTELNRERHLTLLLATHAIEIARTADRIVHLRDGIIEREEIRQHASV
jgi:putative ABC transport system ATP-binding protein